MKNRPQKIIHEQDGEVIQNNHINILMLYVKFNPYHP